MAAPIITTIYIAWTLLAGLGRIQRRDVAIYAAPMKYIKAHLRETKHGLILVPGHFRRQALPAYKSTHERKLAASKGQAARTKERIR